MTTTLTPLTASRAAEIRHLVPLMGWARAVGWRRRTVDDRGTRIYWWTHPEAGIRIRWDHGQIDISTPRAHLVVQVAGADQVMAVLVAAAIEAPGDLLRDPRHLAVELEYERRARATHEEQAAEQVGRLREELARLRAQTTDPDPAPPALPARKPTTAPTPESHRLAGVLAEVAAARQHHPGLPDGTGEPGAWPARVLVTAAERHVARAREDGSLTHMDLLRLAAARIAATTTQDSLRGALIRAMGLGAGWVVDMDGRQQEAAAS